MLGATSGNYNSSINRTKTKEKRLVNTACLRYIDGAYPYAQSPYGPQCGFGPYGPSPMVMMQPGMPAVQRQPSIILPPARPMPGVPAGLEHFAATDEIIVDQIPDFVGIDAARNHYSLCNSAGQQAYFAYDQDSDEEKKYEVNLIIADNDRKPLIVIRRPFACCSGCGCFGLNGCCRKYNCTIESPPGKEIGHIVQGTSCCHHSFGIYNNSNELMYYVAGNICRFNRVEDFSIYDNNSKEKIGSINKIWGDMAKEMLTEAETFQVIFPKEIDVNWKAVFLGATFFIDFMTYEDTRLH